MPYITKDRRRQLNNDISFTGPGDLNYVISSTLIRYLELKGLSYQSINDCLGALEGAKLEFYRRVAAPYEDKKIKENGDLPWKV